MINNKKIIYLFSFLILLLLSRPILAQQDNQINLNSSQLKSFDKIKQNSDNIYVNWDSETKIPRWTRLNNLKINWQNNNYTDRIIQFLKEYKDIYRINDPQNELTKVKEEKDSLGMTHVIMQQKYMGIPVYDSKMQFHFSKEGSLYSITGTYLSNINEISIIPKITEEQAIQIAKDKLKVKLNLDDNTFNNLNIQKGSSQLIIYNHGLFSKKIEKSYLTWRISIYSTKDAVNQLYYINASDGSVINNLNNLFEASARATYTMADCADTIGVLAYNETGLVGAADTQAETVNNYMGYVYNYYFDNFSRRSYDNLNGVLIAHTHYEIDDGGCIQYEGASWDPDEHIINIGDDFISLDVVGHEITHAVVQYSVGETDSDTLEYENESGALNESYADIFGEFSEIEANNNGSASTIGIGDEWILGNELPIAPSYSPYTSSAWGSSRSMSDPNSSPKYWQPANVGEELDSTEEPCASSTDAENGCVHYNSGILNNALYLLTVGGTNSYSGEIIDSAEAIGQDKAEQIYYRALTEYLGTASDFSDAYNATMQSCLDFYARGEDSITLADCNTVYKAFHAVGIATDPYFYSYVSTPSGISGYAPLTIGFDASEYRSFGDTIASYNWNFGDGTTGAGVSVNHTYTPGTYTYTITVIDSSGDENISSGTITANNPITPTFTISGDGVAAPATVSFNATATTDATGTIMDYSWNFGDGGISSSGSTAATTHNYITGGYFNAILTVTDNNGYTNTYNKSVFIGTTGPTYVSGTIYNDTWTAARSPYVVNGPITVASGGTLTIEPGVVVKLYYYAEVIDFNIEINGTLDILGTAADPVIFTSLKDDTYGGDTNGDGSATTPTINDWFGLVFNPASTANIDNMEIKYGENALQIYDANSFFVTNSKFTDNNYPMIIYDSSSASNETIDNNIIDGTVLIYGGSSSINNNLFDAGAINLYDGAAPTIVDNNFINSYSTIYIDTTFSNRLFISNNTCDNVNNGILLHGIEINSDITLNASNNNCTYLIDEELSVANGSTLTIEPGSVIKLNDRASNLTISGTLNAQGTASDQIIFTSIKDDAYGGDTNGDGVVSTPAAEDWGYINFDADSSGNIDYATISYGGAAYYYADNMIKIYSNNVAVTNSNIIYSGQSGIYTNNSNITLSNNVISNNVSGINLSGGTPAIVNNAITNNIYPILISSPVPSSFSVSGNSFSGNTYNAIVISASTTGDSILSASNDLPYLINGLTVDSGDTLTIESGTVIKLFNSISAYITVDGNLDAHGTSLDPIIFTSVKDDTYGGDTNNDGAATTPASGDWPHIDFNSGSIADINYAIINYGGFYGHSYGEVEVSSNNFSITNSIISNSPKGGIYIDDCSPNISDNTFTSNYYGIYEHDGAPTISGNIFTSNRYGIYDYAGTPTISNNDIYNNSSYGFYNPTSVSITAENNWWGSASGPYNATSNPTGTGNAIGNYIDFDPWLSASINAPTDVSSLTARADVWQHKINLRWVNPSDSDFAGVKIDRFDGTTTTTLATGITGTGYLDATPAYNIAYTYTIYAVDTDGNQSSGVAISRLIQNPAPRTFIATAANTQINLAWRASTAPAAQIGGYRVYYRQAGVGAYVAVDVGNVASHTISGLTNGTLYQVYVVAYSTTGIESPKSLTRIARPRP